MLNQTIAPATSERQMPLLGTLATRVEDCYLGVQIVVQPHEGQPNEPIRCLLTQTSEEEWQLEQKMVLSSGVVMDEGQVQDTLKVARHVLEGAYLIQQQGRVAAEQVCDPVTHFGEGYIERDHRIIELTDPHGFAQARKERGGFSLAGLRTSEEVEMRQAAFSSYAHQPIAADEARTNRETALLCAFALLRLGQLRQDSTPLREWLATLDRRTLDRLVLTPNPDYNILPWEMTTIRTLAALNQRKRD